MKIDAWVDHFLGDRTGKYLKEGGSLFRVLAYKGGASDELLQLLQSKIRQNGSCVIPIGPLNHGEFRYRSSVQIEGLYSMIAKACSFRELAMRAALQYWSTLFAKQVSQEVNGKKELLEVFGLQDAEFRRELIRPFTMSLLSNEALSRSFASAIILMVQCWLHPSEKVDERVGNGELIEILNRWFEGDRPKPGDKVTLRRHEVYSWLDKKNSKVMLSSLLHIRQSLHEPPVIAIYGGWDSREAAVNRTQWLNLLHTMRTFIDDIEFMHGIAVILAVNSMTSDNQSGRRLSDYEAFYLRVYNEFREFENPDSVLVTLE